MSKKNKQAISGEDKTTQEEILDALLGDGEDCYDEVRADDLLNTMGIDSSSLISGFDSYLQKEARRLERERKPVPQALKDAMKSIRTEIKASDPMAVDPKDWIGGLLSGTPSSPSINSSALSLRRREGEDITAEDVEILDNFKLELELEEE